MPAHDRAAVSSAFVATLGTEPQVVTVTLDLLETIVPTFDRVIVLHTVPGEDKTGERIAASITDVLRELHAYQAEGRIAHFELVALRHEDGSPVADIHTQQDADSVFTAIRGLVRAEKRAARRVHLNAAGGRKGMTLYAMAAAQMHFDDDDCLWLLASSDTFQASRDLHPRTPDDARLIPIPVYRHLSRTSSELQRKRDFLLRLSDRERRIVEGIAHQRHTARQIAAALGIAEKTVENHIYDGIFPELREFLRRDDVSRQDIVAEFAAYFAAYPPDRAEAEPGQS